MSRWHNCKHMKMPFRRSDARNFKEIRLLSVTDELDELVV
jgi:hypothetical protein